MATSVIPKSAIRENNNITVGYGEVPAIDIDATGNPIWGLPNGQRTNDRRQAQAFAQRLDAAIRANLRDVKDLMVSRKAAI